MDDIRTEEYDTDVMVATDETTGITYVFRGRRTYMVVDGKEVLIDRTPPNICIPPGTLKVSP